MWGRGRRKVHLLLHGSSPREAHRGRRLCPLRPSSVQHVLGHFGVNQSHDHLSLEQSIGQLWVL